MSKLTVKQKNFIAAYLTSANFNATEAARLAGYEGDDVTLASVGYENLRKPQILEQVRASMRERAMEPEEIIGRLSDMGRASIGDFVTVQEHGGWTVDLPKAVKNGKMHLIKKYKDTEEGVELTLHDPLRALETLAKIHKMFGEQQINIEVNTLNLILNALPMEYREPVRLALEAGTQP
jgi:phage terminase small subunit